MLRSSVTRQQLPKARCHIIDATQITITVAWMKVVGADAYDIKVPNASVDFSTNDTSCVLTGLTPGTTYDVYVRATSSHILGPWRGITASTSAFVCQTLLHDDSPLHPISTDACSACNLQVCAKCSFYGCLDSNTTLQYRFGTFYAGTMQNQLGATLHILAPVSTWRVDTNGMLTDTFLHVSISNGPWLDANAIHMPHCERAMTHGWPCAARSKTTHQRRITFGGMCMSGDVRVRIGICADSRRFAGIVLDPEQSSA